VAFKCVVCGKESKEFVGCVCVDCFRKVGSKVCCICGKKIDGVAKEYCDSGLTERDGKVDIFHGLVCEKCAISMVQCKVCGCFVPQEVAIDYIEIGTGKETGEKICFECYLNNFVECSKCKGLISKSLKNIKWTKKGKIICSFCAEELQKKNLQKSS
jgi:hypothetical protein